VTKSRIVYVHLSCDSASHVPDKRARGEILDVQLGNTWRKVPLNQSTKITPTESRPLFVFLLPELRHTVVKIEAVNI
jgi:hypothetical protein